MARHAMARVAGLALRLPGREQDPRKRSVQWLRTNEDGKGPGHYRMILHGIMSVLGRTRLLNWFVAENSMVRLPALLVIALAGSLCGGCCGDGVAAPSSPADHQVGYPEVPVVYDADPGGVRLERSTLDDIVRWAGARAPKGQGVWFIKVYYTDLHTDNWLCRVYYLPQETGPRVRRGLGIGYSGLLPSTRPTQVAGAASGREEPRLFEYTQVSEAGAPFTDQVSAPDPNTPWLWPFDCPDGFAQEEVIEILDAVRACKTRYPSPGWPPSIGRMRREGNGEVSVEFGPQLTGPYPFLSGISWSTMCVRRDGEWKVIAEISTCYD